MAGPLVTEAPYAHTNIGNGRDIDNRRATLGNSNLNFNINSSSEINASSPVINMSHPINALSDISLPLMEFPDLNSELEGVSAISHPDQIGSYLDESSNTDISIGSIPLLDQTPCVIDDVTPNLSQGTNILE